MVFIMFKYVFGVYHVYVTFPKANTNLPLISDRAKRQEDIFYKPKTVTLFTFEVSMWIELEG